MVNPVRTHPNMGLGYRTSPSHASAQRYQPGDAPCARGKQPQSEPVQFIRPIQSKSQFKITANSLESGVYFHALLQPTRISGPRTPRMDCSCPAIPPSKLCICELACICSLSLSWSLNEIAGTSESVRGLWGQLVISRPSIGGQSGGQSWSSQPLSSVPRLGSATPTPHMHFRPVIAVQLFFVSVKCGC